MTERDRDTTVPSAPPPGPSGNAERARTVASELEDIFAGIGQLPPRSAAAADADFALPVAERAPVRRRSMMGTLGAVATVLLVGGAVGVLANREQWLQPEASRSARAMTVAVAPQRSVSPATLPAATPPVADAGAPTPLAPAAPAANVEVAPAAPTATRASPRVEAPIDTPRAAPPPNGVASLPSPDQVDDCASPAPAAQARCLSLALGEAEGRLRDAYDTALDARVPLAVLLQYRAEWDGLRRRAPREPDAVIESYDAMVDELQDYAADARGPG